MGKNFRFSVEENATTTEASKAFEVENVFMMVNDGTDDVYLNFDAATTSTDKITLKPGEVVNNFPADARVLHYRAKTGSQPFRVWGFR